MLSRAECNTLYRKHAPGAFRRAQRMLGSVADADDVVHDVFLALFERYDQFRGASSLSTYLYSAVTHACLNRIRNHRRRDLSRVRQQVAGPSCDPGTSAEASVLARDLLERLPDRLAEVAVYHHLDQLTQREIAGILGCSHTHVAHLIERLSSWARQQERTTCPP